MYCTQGHTAVLLVITYANPFHLYEDTMARHTPGLQWIIYRGIIIPVYCK